MVAVTTLSELVEIVARVEGLDPATVSLIAREVREAGLIKTGGRGLSAAKMGFPDAANLLIAVNVSSVVREASKLIATYRDLDGWEIKAEPQATYRDFEFWDVNNPALRQVSTTKLGRPVNRFGYVLESILEAFARRRLSDRQRWCASADSEFREAFSRGHASVQLTFFKPQPRVDLRMMRVRPGPLQDGYPEYIPPLLHFVFKSSMFHGRQERTDRTELTRIGSFTLNVVATSLMAPLTASRIIAGKRSS
jgi:hypothetical protein